MGVKFVPGRLVEVFFDDADCWFRGVVIDRVGTVQLHRGQHNIWGGAKLARCDWSRMRDPIEFCEEQQEECDVA